MNTATIPVGEMDVVLTPEQEAFRQEVRAFAAEAVTPELLQRTNGAIEAYVPEFHRAVAARGWIGVQWPREFGGRGATPLEMAVFFEEMGRALAPLGRYVGSTVFVGGSIISYGRQDQRAEFLSRIAAGKLLGSFALTEPEAGSDAAAIRTSAVRDGDHWVVRGEKVFISGAELADCILTVVRTDPEAGKYRGISLLLVPGDAPGLSVRPLHTVAGLRVNVVVYDEVRVPVDRLLGVEGNGWEHLQTTFGLERSLSSAQLVGSLFRLYNDLHTVVLAEVRAGRFPVARLDDLYDCRAELEAAPLLSYRACWLDQNGALTLDEAAVCKLTRSELALRLATVGLDLLGEAGLIAGPAAVLGGRLEALYRRAQFYITAGGTNDIQRGLLAQRGLGLPRR